MRLNEVPRLPDPHRLRPVAIWVVISIFHICSWRKRLRNGEGGSPSLGNHWLVLARTVGHGGRELERWEVGVQHFNNALVAEPHGHSLKKSVTATIGP